VNYHFRSKEKLYIEVFRTLFDGFRKPLLSIPDQVHDAASWQHALKEWVEYSLRISTSNKPPDTWVTQLVVHERTDPTAAMPILYKQFFEPLKEAVARIVRMGMPPGSTDTDVHMVTLSLMAQCIVFHHRKPPWGKLLIPPGVDREAWVARMARFIVEGITSRFSYRTNRV
jgi:AcrR family transcriptional regulator